MEILMAVRQPVRTEHSFLQRTQCDCRVADSPTESNLDEVPLSDQSATAPLNDERPAGR